LYLVVNGDGAEEFDLTVVAVPAGVVLPYKQLTVGEKYR